jgi:hypothetical protein
MTNAIAQAKSNIGVVSSVLTPDIVQLASDIARLAISDPAPAAQVMRDLMATLPDASNGDLISAVTSGLDDEALQGLSNTPPGRELLDVLASQPHDQLGRIRGALQAVAQMPGGWIGAMAQQVIHPGLLDGASSGSPAMHGDAANAEQVKSAFKQEFAAKAANKQEFDAFMQQVYGDKYDKNLAEQYRQKALAGDFSWLPDVKFVDAATLHGGNGAYNEQEGVVYINKDVAASDPAKAAQVFVEEAGAHLDAKLNTADTQGDEGEMFRRVLGGEHLSQQEISVIRNDDDHGTITVDGKQVDVEFWFGEDFVDAVGDAGKAIGNAASDAVDAIGGAASDAVDAVGSAAGDVVDYAGTAARDVVYSLGDVVKEAGMGLIDGVGMFMRGFAVDFFGGTVINLMQGRFADAFESMTRGLDNMVFQAPRRIFNGALEGVGHWVKTATYLLPEKAGGAFMREVIDRGVDSVRSVANGAIDIVRNTALMPLRIVGDFEHDMGEALKHWARGDIGGGFEHFGMAFVHPFETAAGTVVDDVMIAAQAGGNVFGNVFGIHEPSRGLSKDEREFLKQTYGDSLNLEDIRVHRGNLTHELGMAPHTVGNDIYLPDEGPNNCFNADGSLNEQGRMTLVHEAFHVYQAQHGGNGYIHEALEAQVGGIVDSGNRNAAYNWLPALRSGKPFDEWNPEQQAELIETMARARSQSADTDRTKPGLESYDLDHDGQIDRNEMDLAAGDTDHDGHIDTAETADLDRDGMIDDTDGDGRIDTGETAVTLTEDEFQRLMAIADALKADRPDRTLV